MSSFLATSGAERVSTPCIICSGHAWCPGHDLSMSVLPLLKAMHHICLFSWYYTYSIHLHQLAVHFTGATHITHISLVQHTSHTFHWCNTHHTHSTGATHITHTTIKTHFILESLPRPWKTIRLQSDILMLSTHSCTMAQSTCANYVLKSAVP